MISLSMWSVSSAVVKRMLFCSQDSSVAHGVADMIVFRHCVLIANSGVAKYVCDIASIKKARHWSFYDSGSQLRSSRSSMCPSCHEESQPVDFLFHIWLAGGQSEWRAIRWLLGA